MPRAFPALVHALHLTMHPGPLCLVLVLCVAMKGGAQGPQKRQRSHLYCYVVPIPLVSEMATVLWQQADCNIDDLLTESSWEKGVWHKRNNEVSRGRVSVPLGSAGGAARFLLCRSALNTTCPYLPSSRYSAVSLVYPSVITELMYSLANMLSPTHDYNAMCHTESVP